MYHRNTRKALGECKPLPWTVSAVAIQGCFMIKIKCQSPATMGNHRNLVFCSLAHCQHFLKILLKYVPNFSSYFANGQTDASCRISISFGGVFSLRRALFCCRSLSAQFHPEVFVFRGESSSLTKLKLNYNYEQ